MYIRERGFTLIELLVVIAIIAILAAIIFPVLTASKQRASMTACSSNFHQLWTGLTLYSDDHLGKMPPFLASLHPKYVSSGQTYHCRDDITNGGLNKAKLTWFGAPDWEFDQGFLTVWRRSGFGCSYAYMPRARFFHESSSGGKGLWSGDTALSPGEWVDAATWVGNFASFTPVLFDYWHAQYKQGPDPTLRSPVNQKVNVIVLIMGGSVKHCQHERLLPCAAQIGSAQDPRHVLR